VALAWPDKDKFDELAAKPDKYNKPLTWTHFRRLASEKDAAKREQLIEGCLNNGWSVRDLKRHMEGNVTPTAAPDGANTESKPLDALAPMIQGYELQVVAFKQRTGKFREHLTAKINAVDPSDCNDESLDHLLVVRHSLKELIDEFDATFSQFMERRKSHSVAPSASEVTVSDGSGGQMRVHADRNPSVLGALAAASVTG
jgi:hypothetical protein